MFTLSRELAAAGYSWGAASVMCVRDNLQTQRVCTTVMEVGSGSPDHREDGEEGCRFSPGPESQLGSLFLSSSEGICY